MYKSIFHTPVGFIEIIANDSALLAVTFKNEVQTSTVVPANDITQNAAGQLAEYFAGTRKTFDLPLAPDGTTFQQSVWNELVKIPFGKTDCYSAIAHKLNNPLSVRAVGAANGKNPIAIIIPCHRIIGADGSLTGYAGGLWRKEFLLRLEGDERGIQTSLW